MPRASRAGRRYQARLNFGDGMGELWQWVTSFPEGHRVQEIWYHLQLGIKTQRALSQAAAGVLLGAHPAPACSLPAAGVRIVPAAAEEMDDDWDPVALSTASAA